MKRWLVRICAFLLLGAIVNVAVAWGCACWVGFDTNSYFDSPSGGVLDRENGYQHWLLSAQRKPGACLVSSQWGDANIGMILTGSWPDKRPEGLIPEWATHAQPPSKNESRDHWHYRWVDARGWPMLAAWSGVECDTVNHGSSEPVRFISCIAIDEPTLGTMRSLGANQRLLPLRPIWPGFVINTLVYALMVLGAWLLFAAPFALRRRRRIKRGLCPKCAYPTGASDVCTECGRPLVAPSR